MEPCVEPIKSELTRIASSPFRYLELGVAEGLTMAGVGRHLKTLPIEFHLYGVDIVDGWSLNLVAAAENLEPFGENVLLNFTGSQAYLSSVIEPFFDFILVDGCHGEECVLADIKALYPTLKKGGIACFHDSDDAAQGMDIQPHCNQPIQVRSALTKAGILDGSNKDWKLLHDINNVTVGRGCVMVEKI